MLFKAKKKGGGGTRPIEEPSEKLKGVQKLILERVLNPMPVHGMLYGGKGTSVLTAVQPHTRKPFVMTMDIKDFYPSIRPYMVRAALQRGGSDASAAKVLTRLVTRKNHLPQGAPTSPCIARLVISPLCGELNGLLNDIHPAATASIYVDDITISGPNGLERIEQTIIRIFRRHRFTIKQEKTRRMGMQASQESLGIKLNRGPEPTEKFVKEVKELSETLPPGDPSLKGKLAYIASLKKSKASVGHGSK